MTRGVRIAVSCLFLATAISLLAASPANAHYDPHHGRWLQRDPMGYAASGMNLYEYVRSNPLAWSDPTGRSPYQIGTKPPRHPDPWTPPSDHASETPDEDSTNWYRIAHIAASQAGWFWDDASKHLKHYLGNTGSQYTIDARGLFTEDSQAKRLFFTELNRAMQFVERKAKGRNRGFHIVSQEWDKGHTLPYGNWYLATFRFRAYGGGPAEILSNCRYKIRFTYHFDDPYDWHAKLKTDICGITITDDMMRHLHLTGLAKEYHMVGRYTKAVTWKKGQYFNVNSGVLEDPGR